MYLQFDVNLINFLTCYPHNQPRHGGARVRVKLSNIKHNITCYIYKIVMEVIFIICIQGILYFFWTFSEDFVLFH